MSKNMREPRRALRRAVLHNEQVQEEQNSSNAPLANPSNSSRQFKVPATPDLNGHCQEAQGNANADSLYPSNGMYQLQVPATPNSLEQSPVEQLDTQVIPAYPSYGIQSFQEPSTAHIYTPDTPPTSVPATPIPWAEPVPADQRRQERIERYAQWLSANNSLTLSPQTLQAYQDASLQFKKVRNREVRTFAPFQERISALQVITTNQLVVFGIMALAWVAGLVLLHLVLFTITLSIITLLYISGFITSSILATNSFRSNSGERIDEEIITALDERGVEWPSYTILCPLYRESAIVPQFVEAIKSLDYPSEKLQVLFLTEENDSETRMALYNMRLPRSFTILTVPEGSPQTKPRACNFGLLQAKGQFIVIFDAEDKPEPYQLKKAVLAFANLGPEVACVQAKLNYYNTRQNLLTRWFTAEYSTWFDIMLPGLQKSGFSLPLGGTSNHFRTEVLRALGGWDAFNVTEDCDLGLRISQYGLKTAVLDSTTYEEATSRVKVWLFQRSRWIKGYLQTYFVHMRHPVQTLRQGHLRKFFSLQLIVGAWTVVLFLNPFMWALTMIYILFRPVQLYSVLFPGPILYMGAFCLIFGNFFYVYIHLIGCAKRKEYALIKWVLLIPFYWVMMSMSAYIAFYQLIVKPHYWEKTQHGNHLAPSAHWQAHYIQPTFGHDGEAVVVSMPTMRMFAVTVGKIFKQTAVADKLGTTTQRVKAIRSTLSIRLGKHKNRRQIQLPRIQDRWLITTTVVALLVSILSTWYSFQRHDILLYGDAYTHMHIARSLIDSLTPGLAQLGGVWLPLPHLIMLPFIWNDFLWQTGLAGSISSMICYVIASSYLFLTARRLTKNSFASFVGTLVFILNPNVIYLQTTPLSEPVCFATFAMAGFYFVVWSQENNSKYLAFAAASTFLATIARYDGWILFLSMFILVVLIGLAQKHSWRQIEANLLLFGVLGSLGIVLWLIWNKIIFGDPLYFQHGIYSSQSQMQYFYSYLFITRHNLWQSIYYYGFACLDTLGPIISILVIIAIIKFMIRRHDVPEMLAALSFLTPLVFYIYSFYSGQVIMLVPGVSSQLFNARFGTEAALPASLFISTLISISAKQRYNSSSNMILHCLLGVIIISQSVLIATNGIISLEDGQYGFSCVQYYAVNSYLAQHYNGGLILEDSYLNSPNESQEVGIDLKKIIYQGSGALWKSALKNPGAMVDWIIIAQRSKESPYPVQVNTTSNLFKSEFTLVVSSKGFDLYLRNGLPPLPTRPMPMNLLIEHQYCNTGKYPQKGQW